MEPVLKIVEQRLRRTPPAKTHPEAELLAAFTEKSLTERERSQVLEHLAHCTDCREIVSLALPATITKPELQPQFRKKWLTWPTLRWAAMAACLFLAGGALVARYGRHRGTEVASLTAKAPDRIDESASKMAGPVEKDAGPVNKKGPPPSRASESDLESGALAKTVGALPQVSEGSGIGSGVSSPQNKRSLAIAKPPSPAKESLAPSSEAVTVVAAGAPSAPDAKAAGGAGIANDASQVQMPAVTNEVVEVTGEAPLVQTETAPLTRGKAKGASAEQQNQNQNSPFMGRNFTQLIALVPAGRWMVTGSGAVERSLDEGKTWQVVPIAEHVVFRTVSVIGNDIWVGGASGALFHSSDGGQSWVQVKLSSEGVPLTAEISSLDFNDASHGHLATVDHQVWITNNGGVSWQKQ